MRMGRGDGGRTDTGSGTGHGVGVTRTAHSTHRQASDSCAAGPGAAWLLSLDNTRKQCVSRDIRGLVAAVNCAAKMSSRVAQCLMSLVFQPFASASSNVLGGLPGEQRDRRTGRFASVIALAPAGWVRTSGQRSWSRCSVSLSPRGNTTFRCALSCTSGRSSTASTRLARRPGAMCPDSARSDAQAVPPGPWEVTSAAATVHVWSLISTCRCSSRPAMPAARPRQGGQAGGSVLGAIGHGAQPRVTAVIRTRRGDGGRTGSRSDTGHGAGPARTSH